MTELGEMIEKMPARAEQIIRQVAFRAEGHMKQRAAVDTGAMRDSVFTEIVDNFTAEVGPSVEYAIYQEFGTSRMAAHPFVIPGALAAAFDLEKLAPELFE
jgi:HK97 gp10 family phage protein